RIFGVGIDARADRGPSEVDLGEERCEFAKPGHILPQRCGKGVKFLTKRQRGRILQLRSPELDNVDELLALALEFLRQMFERAPQRPVGKQDRQANSRWIDVVGRL